MGTLQMHVISTSIDAHIALASPCALLTYHFTLGYGLTSYTLPLSATLCLLGIALLPRRKTGPPQSPNCLDHFRVAPSDMHRHSNKFILKGLFG